MLGGWSSAALVSAALLAVGCSGGGGSGDDAADVPGCGTDADEVGAEGERTLEFDGGDRAYLLAVPEDYDGREPFPLILSLHGFGVGKEAHEADTAMAETATARGYLVATPDASGGTNEWSIFDQAADHDDFAWMDALLGELRARLCVDPERIYAAGHSAGGVFAGFLACREPFPIAATAMVSGFVPPTCPAESAAPSVIAFHGLADPVVPYDGGDIGLPVPVPAVPVTLGYYADQYGCGAPAMEDQPVPGVERRRLSGCSDGADVVLYTVQEGGHEWPHAGVDGAGLAATDLILEFFDGHVG